MNSFPLNLFFFYMWFLSGIISTCKHTHKEWNAYTMANGFRVIHIFFVYFVCDVYSYICDGRSFSKELANHFRKADENEEKLYRWRQQDIVEFQLCVNAIFHWVNSTALCFFFFIYLFRFFFLKCCVVLCRVFHCVASCVDYTCTVV